jgi:hypothetical protein
VAGITYRQRAGEFIAAAAKEIQTTDG